MTPLMMSARAERFPRKKELVASRLDVYKSRGIEGYAAKYKKAGIALITHAREVPILAGHVLDLGHFLSDYATPQQTNHKRKPSETLMHQHRRPFHVDEASAEFSQPNVTTEIEHAPIARTEGITTDVERSREDDENHRHELPSGGPGPGRALSESDRQQSPNRGTDASTDNRHGNDRIHTFETLRATMQGFSPSRFVSHQLSHDVQEVRQHPQASGDTSSPSFAALSVPDSMAIQSHIRDAPILDSRSMPESDVPIQERSGSPQSRQRLEADATPGTREEPNTTANNINSSSAQESPTQNLSPIQSHGHGLSHNATEISYLQRRSPPLHPPTTQITLDSIAIQSHVIGTLSSGLQPETHQFTVQEHLDSTRSLTPTNLSLRGKEFVAPCEALESQHSLQGRQTSMLHATSPVQSQPYQPQDPEDTGCLDQPMDQAPVMSYQPFEVYQDNDPSATDIDWNNITSWDFEDVSTSNLLFQESGEALSP